VVALYSGVASLKWITCCPFKSINVIRNGCVVVIQGMKVKFFSLQFASLIFLCLTFSTISFANPYTSVEQLRWKHRLIVAVQYQQPVDRATLATWVRERFCQLSERDVVFLLIEDKRAHELTRVGVALNTDSIKELINRSASNSQTSQYLLLQNHNCIMPSLPSILV